MIKWIVSAPVSAGIYWVALAFRQCLQRVALAFRQCSRVALAFRQCCIVALAICFCSFGAIQAQTETSKTIRPDFFQGHSGESVRQSAIQSLPMDKLDAQDRAKVHAVLANVTIFRRLPVRVVDCDPDLYLFLVRHPDVVINIWNTLKISQLQLKQTGPKEFRLKEDSGVTADLEYLYRGHDTHLIYAEGVYEGATFSRQVKGAGLFCLKSGYIRETDGRYYITSRLDAFISIEPSAVELVAKTLHPLLGATADNNFTQTIAFVGSLSRNAEQNSRSIQRLAAKLNNVQPDVREQFAQLAENISEKPSSLLLRQISEIKTVARKDDDSLNR
jgi:hypothetical protein